MCSELTKVKKIKTYRRKYTANKLSLEPIGDVIDHIKELEQIIHNHDKELTKLDVFSKWGFRVILPLVVAFIALAGSLLALAIQMLINT